MWHRQRHCDVGSNPAAPSAFTYKSVFRLKKACQLACQQSVNRLRNKRKFHEIKNSEDLF